MQDASKDDQHQHIQSKETTDETDLLFGLHVVHKERGRKERNVNRDPHRNHAPPGIDPVENGCTGKKDLDQRNKECIPDDEQPAIVNAQNLLLGVFRQQFAHHKSCDGKHE